jgi:intraflagellar transport protein 140
MKALLRSGDTEKVIFFAGVSRTREIYILAANYLQSLNWHTDPEVMRHVIGFYSKARAWEALAGFYEACADVEVDEYRNYDKAAAALRESLKALGKGKGADRDTRAAGVQDRLGTVEAFLAARANARAAPSELVRLCEQLLAQPETGAAVRAGDLLGALVEVCATHGDMDSAGRYVETLHDRGLDPAHFVGGPVLTAVTKSMGASPPRRSGRAGAGAGGDGEVGEDIAEDV